MTKPIIVTFVGIPGSGKTTFARQLAKELRAVTLNSDSIRISMWKTLEAIQATHVSKEKRAHNNQLTFGAMNYAASQIVEAGYSVIYDCNANAFSEREEKHEIAKKYNALSVVVRIKVPHEVALERVQDREEAHDQRRITTEKAEDVLNRFANEIEEPTISENVIEILGDVSFNEQFAIFQNQIRKFRDEPTSAAR